MAETPQLPTRTAPEVHAGPPAGTPTSSVATAARSTSPGRPAARPVTPVGIVAAELGSLHEELSDLLGRGLDPGLHDGLLDRLARARDLAAGLDPYLVACTTAASPALDALARATAEADWAGDDLGGGSLEQEMLSGHVEGALLRTLVRLTRATRVLDVGMFTGYSSLAMAEALPPGGTVVACEVDDDVARFARRCFAASPAADRIRVEVAPAGQTLARLAAAGERFDLVFLDADKPSYVDYLTAVLDGDLLAPHGVVAVDNTLMQGEPWAPLADGTRSTNGDAVADFNRVLADDPRVEQVLLPLRDGVTLVHWADPTEREPGPEAA